MNETAKIIWMQIDNSGFEYQDQLDIQISSIIINFLFYFPHIYIFLSFELLYSHVWCVWWWLDSNENYAEVGSCNAECGSTGDRRFGW